MKDVPVDNSARMDAVELDKMLAECIKAEKEDERTPVYAVVAIMGSTEQGAVDPLAAILELRTKYQEKGLSFVVHCDGAWGGYFASMIHDRKHNNLTTLTSIDSDTKKSDSRVPVQALTPYTADQLAAYPGADSITIDPHKSDSPPLSQLLLTYAKIWIYTVPRRWSLLSGRTYAIPCDMDKPHCVSRRRL